MTIEMAKEQIFAAVHAEKAKTGEYEFDLYLKLVPKGIEELDAKAVIPGFERKTRLFKKTDPDVSFADRMTDRIMKIVEPLRPEWPCLRVLVSVGEQVSIRLGH